MKALLIAIVCMLLMHQYAFCQLQSDRKALKTLIKTNTGEISGYISGATSDSLFLYSIEYRKDSAIAIHTIDRIAVLQKGSFKDSFVTAFAISEPIILFTALTTDDFFGPAFYLVIGNIFIVAPVSVLSGLVGTTPNIKLDLSDQADIKQLGDGHLSKFFFDKKEFRTTRRGIIQINDLTFSEKPNPKRLQLGYSPVFHITALQFGRNYNNMLSTLQNSLPNGDQFYEDNDNINAEVGIAYSPNSYWEVGYLLRSVVDSYQYANYELGNNEFASAQYNLTYFTHSLQVLRKFSSFQQGISDNWQFNAGALLSLMPNIIGNSFSIYHEEYTQEFHNSQKSTSAGIGLIGSIDYYLTRNFSFRLSIDHSWFTPIKIDGYDFNESNLSFEKLTLHPQTTNVSFGLRGSF